MANKKIHIYKIWFPTSNKCYIGLTCDIKRRMFMHLSTNSLVGNALNKYNDWQVSILHTCKTYDQAFRIEIEEIRNFNSVAPNGYNLTRGGDKGPDQTGYKHTEESKKKAGHFGNQYAKGKNLGNQHAKGYKHTEEWKQNKSKEMQGKQYAKGSKHPAVSERNKIMNKNPKVKLKQQIGRVKNYILKLEKENDNN